MVERFHRQLKAALRSQPQPHLWSENLALVLLGIRSSLKPDLGASVAELVYGTPLRLPGELFVSSSSDDIPDPSSYLSRLQQFARSLRPAVPRPPPSSRVFHVPSALTDCSHVYVRVDGVRPPLSTPYDGPFRVIRRSARYYEVDINGTSRVISIVRLKPAYLDDTHVSSLSDELYSPFPPDTSDLLPAHPARRRIHFAVDP